MKKQMLKTKAKSFKEIYYMSAREIIWFYGCSKQTAYRRLKKAREQFNKPPGSLVSVEEFSESEGICIEMLRKFKAQH